MYSQIPLATRFWQKVDKSGDCWLWTGAQQRYGYGVIGISPGYGNGRVARAHRVAWELTYGPIPSGLSVLHRCDNPPCVNPTHLLLGSHRDNIIDMYAKRRWRRRDTTRVLRGEDHPFARLTDVEVERIRELRTAGVSCVAIAREFRITPGWVGQIANNHVRVNPSK